MKTPGKVEKKATAIKKDVFNKTIVDLKSYDLLSVGDEICLRMFVDIDCGNTRWTGADSTVEA